MKAPKERLAHKLGLTLADVARFAADPLNRAWISGACRTSARTLSFIKQDNMLLTAERAMRKERTLVATGFEAGDPDRRHCDPLLMLGTGSIAADSPLGRSPRGYVTATTFSARPLP